MARDVVTYIWCDFCLGQDDTKTDAEELPPITVGTNKPRVLALCKEHRETWYEPMVEALKEFGVIVDGSSPAKSVIRPTSPMDPKGTLEVTADGRVLCPVCKAEGVLKPFKNRNTIMTHVRSDHGTTLGAWEREHGPAQGELPLDEESTKPHPLSSDREPPDEDKRRECPECKAQGRETVYEWPVNLRPVQALAVHRSRAHGVKGGGKNAGKNRRREAARQAVSA